MASSPRRRRPRLARIVLHAFLAGTAVVWLVPIVFALYASFRPDDDVAARGYLSVPHRGLTLANYELDWQRVAIPHHFLNTLLIVVPAVALMLAGASCVAFVVARTRFRLAIPVLVFFVAASLLPPQVIATPLYRLYLDIPLPTWLSSSGVMFDSIVGVIVIHVAFQLGFCTFVLAAYMRTLPSSLEDAARMDGAGLVRQLLGVTLPLCKPALAALAVLEFTWVYNDFFWALVLMTSAKKWPLTTVTGDVFGNYYQVNGQIAAGSFIVAAPTILVFLFFRRQLVRGLTMGAVSG